MEEPHKSLTGLIVNISLFLLIIISVVALALDTVESLHQEHKDLFAAIELFALSVFTVEYVVRIYANGHLEKFAGLKGKLQYMKTPFALIDLIAIVPFLFAIVGYDTYFIRVLRILRVFKLFHLYRAVYFDDVIFAIIKERREEFLVSFVFIIILTITFAVPIYYLENPLQPEVFPNIPETFWWSVVTLTTIGYGDMVPISDLGKVLTSFISVLGIAFYGLPGSIFTAALFEKLKSKHSHEKHHEHHDGEHHENHRHENHHHNLDLNGEELQKEIEKTIKTKNSTS